MRGKEEKIGLALLLLPVVAGVVVLFLISWGSHPHPL